MRRPTTGEHFFLLEDPHADAPPYVDTDASLLVRPWLLQRMTSTPAPDPLCSLSFSQAAECRRYANMICSAIDKLVTNAALHARLTPAGTPSRAALLVLLTPAHVHVLCADQGPGLLATAAEHFDRQNLPEGAFLINLVRGKARPLYPRLRLGLGFYDLTRNLRPVFSSRDDEMVEVMPSGVLRVASGRWLVTAAPGAAAAELPAPLPGTAVLASFPWPPGFSRADAPR